MPTCRCRRRSATRCCCGPATCPAQARATAEAASVAGTRFDVELVAALGWEAGLDELLASGLIVELEPGRAAFRHPLARDAIYEDVPWLRRRSLHRELAAALEARGGGQAEVAAHWLAARDGSARARLAGPGGRRARRRPRLPGRGAARRARRSTCGPRASAAPSGSRCSSATRASRSSRASWPRRPARSARWWRRGAPRAPAARSPTPSAAWPAIYELQGDRERALTARRVAADAFAANGLPGEAAAERLIAAGYLQSAGNHGEAVELTRRAGEEAARAERVDLRARVLGLEGVARVKGGEFDAGMETIRAGLSLALEHELTLEAAEVYQRLGTAHEIAGDYGGARDALATAVGFCEASGADGMEHTCLSCMAYVLRELGDWERAAELSRASCASRARARTPRWWRTACSDRSTPSAASGPAARPLLAQCLDTASRLDVVSMSVDSAAALALLEEQEGDLDQAHAHCRFLLERWARSEDHHYAVWGLRWASCFFARHGALGERARLRRGAVEHRGQDGPPGRAGRARARARRDGARRGPCRRRRAAARPRGRAARQPRDPVRASADPAPRRRGARRGGAARGRGRAARRGARAPRAASAPRRWPPRRPPRSRSSASRSSAGSGGARRPTTRTPASPAASSR